MKKVLFLDRDGTIIVEPPSDYQIDSYEKLEFLPDVLSTLSKIVKELDYRLVMVTNQDGLGTDSFPEDTFWPAHNMMMNILQSEGIEFDEVCIDRSFEEEGLDTRKPGIGMLNKYYYGDFDLGKSFVIGDRDSDISLAINLGAQGIYIGKENNEKAVFSASNWIEIYQYLKAKKRTAKVIRNTKETQIRIGINLDGVGRSSINTGIGFFDHMLEQIARHGTVDLDIDVIGDLTIDEHHTIEDTALALGQAFKEALGSKKAIDRYGFLLPMDDCLAQVAIDFGGRPWIEWEAIFTRESIGEMPTEMFYHFFKSFSDTAKCNLNIKAEGNNEHHKIESIFKAFAKSIKMAIQKNEDYVIPSTKGVL